MKEFLKMEIKGIELIDKKEYENMGRMWLMLNSWNIQEQLYADIVSDGINYEIEEMLEKELEKRLKLLKIWRENAKNGKKSGTIQKNRNENKKNKCKPDD